MRKRYFLLLLAAAACAGENDPVAPEAGSPEDDLEAERQAARRIGVAHTALSGGATTVFNVSADAFSLEAPNLQGLNVGLHEAGDVAFEIAFVPEKGSPIGGLGPVFDNESCEACHLADGRGRPPAGGEPFSSMLFRGSVPGNGAHRSPLAIPGFGTQLQMRAIAGVSPEIQAAVAYVDSAGVFTDGSPYTLTPPRYTLTGVQQALPGGTLVSPRVAPAVFGLGLLEAVPEALILQLADPSDRNRDGISGRANIVWDETRQRLALGRFGWKANTPNLLQQTAAAYNGDMGITSALFPAEPCAGQLPECDTHPPEVDVQTVANVTLYTQTLGVPARRDLNDPITSRGELMFYVANCDGCHAPTLRTGALPGVPEVSGQRIHPYTDLLLHDMGAALADGRPDFHASGSEWRTPPLWGIGLVQTVNGHSRFLHDGRAGTLEEAILWHGGEARRSRERFKRMSRDDRLALVAFLGSL